VTRVDYAALEGYAKARRRSAPGKPGAAAATVRNELATFKQAFKLAATHGQVGAVPVFPTVRVQNTRTVTFTDAEVASILDVLPAPVAAATEFAALTGWRLMECLNLRWDRVDMENKVIRLESGEGKSRRPRVFPFGPRPRLAALLERQRQERWRVEREHGVAVDTVFHRKGRPLKDIDDALADGLPPGQAGGPPLPRPTPVRLRQHDSGRSRGSRGHGAHGTRDALHAPAVRDHEHGDAGAGRRQGGGPGALKEIQSGTDKDKSKDKSEARTAKSQRCGLLFGARGEI